MEDQTLKRFVILRHTPGELFERTEKVHLDWMFEDNGQLRTFSTSTVTLRDLLGSICLEALELPYHRKEYLEFRGDIGNQRGWVSELWRGNYDVLEKSESTFDVCLESMQATTHVRIRCCFTRDGYDQKNPRSTAVWTLKTNPTETQHEAVS
jgi:hypothetical protein